MVLFQLRVQLPRMLVTYMISYCTIILTTNIIIGINKNHIAKMCIAFDIMYVIGGRLATLNSGSGSCSKVGTKYSAI